MASSIRMRLPFPPSVNGLYATDFKTKRRFKSKKYIEWEQNSEIAMYEQRLFRQQPNGFVKINYIFGRPDKRRRDLSNSFKAVDDFLVYWGIIADDSDIHEIAAKWGQVDGVELEISTL